VVGFFGILITLTYLAPHGSAKDVFAKYVTIGGYDPGTSFFVGLITSVFAFLGADGAVHMCEEIKNASTVVPRSLLTSIAINGVLGFAMLIAILFCMGDIETALKSPTGFPFIEIFAQATHSNAGATAMTAIILCLMLSAAVASLAAASRVLWAFARDNGVPGSSYLAYVEPRTKLPLYAICLTTVVTILLGLINIGSSAAFNAVASLLVASFLGSYILPIGLLLYNRITKPSSIVYGPFKLGRFGIATNTFAILWTVLVMVFSFFPPVIPITLSNMNWSCVLWGFTMISGLAFYIFYQRGRYNGPIVETVVLEVQIEGV
jgi:amino acid transporter